MSNEEKITILYKKLCITNQQTRQFLTFSCLQQLYSMTEETEHLENGQKLDTFKISFDFQTDKPTYEWILQNQRKKTSLSTLKYYTTLVENSIKQNGTWPSQSYSRGSILNFDFTSMCYPLKIFLQTFFSLMTLIIKKTHETTWEFCRSLRVIPSACQVHFCFISSVLQLLI